jgi:multidrug efflux pump subunit AcrB
MRRLILIVLIALGVLAVREVADAKSPNASYTFTKLDVPFPGATSSRVDYI